MKDAISFYETRDTLISAPAFDRSNSKLKQRDIEEAVSWFEETTGDKVNTITLNPQYNFDDDRIRHSSGCLAWEIWLSVKDFQGINSKVSETPQISVLKASSEDKKVRQSLPIQTSFNTHKTRALQNPTESRILLIGGRPRKDVPVDRIKKLSKQGMGVRDISRKLKLTPSMVSRVLSGKR